jgi:predicted Zn-dependent protease
MVLLSLRTFQILIVLALCGTAGAVTREEVEIGAERLYRTRIVEAQQRYALDTDPVFLARVQRIATGLIEIDRHEHPQHAALTWEIHTTSDPEESASCMAGGKLLIGRAYATRMELTDAELAMMIAHEIEHAVLEHNLKEFREALRLEPERQQQSFPDLEYAIDHDRGLMSKLAEFDAAQESEADHEGLLLAWRAGWPVLKLVTYFKKMARADPMANFDSREHPASARRWQAMRKMAEDLDQRKTSATPDSR